MVGSNRHASRTGKEARMFVRPIEESAREDRGGQTSYLLLGKGDFDSRSLAVTWVECGPNSQQPLHSHPDAEQAYVIVQGRGEMIVGDEREMVGRGTMILVPPNTEHAIRNPTDESLAYVSATSPPFEPGDVGRWRHPAAE
jgi:mannose-6-phosphate isomerase-like protein (cupin superfamily)